MGGATEWRKLTAAERSAAAVKLRLGGSTYRQIAAKLGTSESTAYRAVKRALDRTNKQAAEDAAELRRLELERLDFASASIWQSVKDGNIGAADVWRRLSESRRKLLGLDLDKGGSRVEVNTPGADGEPVRVVVEQIEFRRPGDLD